MSSTCTKGASDGSENRLDLVGCRSARRRRGAGGALAWAADDDAPQVRVFVNGREVGTGDQAGNGAVVVSIAEAEDTEEPAAKVFLGVKVAPSDEGASVLGVIEDSPAAKAGLKPGDVITAVNDERIEGPAALVERLREHRPGDRIRLSVKRGGDDLSLRVRLGRTESPRPDREERPRKDEEKPEERPAEGRAVLGVMAAPLNDDMREIAGTDKGVLIDSLADDSPAARAGLQPGDVITAIDGKSVAAPSELIDRMRQYKPGDKVEVAYHRMGKRREAVVTLGERPADRAPPLLRIPDSLTEQMPELREHLERMRPQIEEWAKRWQEQGLTPGPQAKPPYDAGKDMGRLMERLERLEQRLGEIERRLDRLEK